MRVVLQRVSQAEVSVAGETIGRIGQGLLALAAVSRQDDENDLVWMARKIVDLRVFDDDGGNLNLSLRDIRGQLLVVSQFTLYGDCKKGRRLHIPRRLRPRKPGRFMTDLSKSYARPFQTFKPADFRPQWKSV
jgi:D-tyrosyl-tRNA(Tyr) deacylase